MMMCSSNLTEVKSSSAVLLGNRFVTDTRRPFKAFNAGLVALPERRCG